MMLPVSYPAFIQFDPENADVLSQSAFVRNAVAMA